MYPLSAPNVAPTTSWRNSKTTPANLAKPIIIFWMKPANHYHKLSGMSASTAEQRISKES